MERQLVIIDTGSGLVKAGFGVDLTPRAVFSSAVVPPLRNPGLAEEFPEHWGNEGTISMRDASFPIERGVVSNWHNMEKLLERTFKELGLTNLEIPVLMSEPCFTTRAHREKKIQIMFETFQVPELFFANSAVLSMYASGITTGTIVDIGDGVSTVVPISEGTAVTDAMLYLNVAGSDITAYLTKLLGYSFSSQLGYDVVKNIKETLSYVALDFDEEIKKFDSSDQPRCQTQFDGKSLTVGTECFQCPEILFQPSLVGCNSNGIHHIIYDSVMRCEVEVITDLFDNITLVGGTSLLPGLGERLEKELSGLLTHISYIEVSTPAERQFSCFIGGTILANLPTFQNMWVKREEYDEIGNEVLWKMTL